MNNASEKSNYQNTGASNVLKRKDSLSKSNSNSNASTATPLESSE